VNSKANIRSELYRETLVDRIVSLMEERILEGGLPPATRISEAWVAREFDVSRAPAREALQHLEDACLVRKTHMGREVAHFSLEEIRELYELKNVVEAFGVKQGAMNATESDIKQIRSIIQDMQDSTLKDDLEKTKKINLQFHDLLVCCSRNQRVIQTYISLAKQVRWVASRSLLIQNGPEQSLKVHLLIFEAFENKKGDEARSLMEAHTNESMKRCLSKLKLKEKEENPLLGREIRKVKDIHSPVFGGNKTSKW
jgi:DNA-binding GntR family transcriptional regulator